MAESRDDKHRYFDGMKKVVGTYKDRVRVRKSNEDEKGSTSLKLHCKDVQEVETFKNLSSIIQGNIYCDRK